MASNLIYNEVVNDEDVVFSTSSYFGEDFEASVMSCKDDLIITNPKFHLLSSDAVEQDFSPIESSIDYDYVQLVDQLTEIQSLAMEADVESPSAYSLVLAELALSKLKQENFLPNRITYTVDGGYCFVFKKSTQALYLEIYNDRELGFIIEDFVKKEIIENKEIELREVAEVIENFLEVE